MAIDHPPSPPLAGPTRATITEAEVVKAAEQLQATGTRPTAMKIRELLGRGSPNTIQPWLEAWRASRAAPEPIPEDLAAEATRRGGEALLALLQTFWPRLRDRISKDFEDRLRDAASNAEESTQELTAATAAIERLESELAAAAQLRLEQDHAHDALAREKADLHARLGQQEAQALHLSQALAQAVATADRAAGDLAAADARHRERLQVLDGRLRDAEATAAAARTETANVREELQSRTVEAQRFTDQYQRASEDLTNLRLSLTSRESALFDLSSARDAVQNKLTALQAELVALQQSKAVLEARLDAQAAERAEHQNALTAILEQLQKRSSFN